MLTQGIRLAGVALALSLGSLGCGQGGNVVFVTRTPYKGNLVQLGNAQSGLAGADALCANAAQAGRIGGTFKAWLSDSKTNAISRITGQGPWVLKDGTQVFTSAASLSGSPIGPIHIDETGADISATDSMPLVWTGTENSGTHSTSTCKDWTSGDMMDMGQTGQVTSILGWTGSAMATCDMAFHLYCFQQ